MMDFGEETVFFVMDGISDGEKAAWSVATGGEPDLEQLDRFAEALDVLRQGMTSGRLYGGWEPTEEDVRAARHLAQLVREGAPREALIEPARRAACVVTDPCALGQLCNILPWLAGEARRIADGEGPPKPDRVREMLDGAAAYFERGGDVAGFVPSPEDLARVQRLRELVTVESDDELAERQRLARELWARLPQEYSARVQQDLSYAEG
jgi:hypothetical protein